MTVPPLPALETAAKEIVWVAQKQGTLGDLTPRLVRQAIEKDFSLMEGVLDASEYKRAIKVAMKYALHNDPPPDAPKTKVSPRNKRKSDGTLKVEEKPALPSPQSSPKAKAKAKAVKKVVSSGGEGSDEQPTPKKRKVVPKARKNTNVPDDEDDYESGDASPPKKEPRPSAGKAKAKKVVSDEDEDEEEPVRITPAQTGKAKPKKDTKAFKSLEHVPTSDMEQDELEPVAGPSVVKTISTEVPRKPKGDSKFDPTPRKPSSSKKTEAAAPKNLKAEDEDTVDKSDSELSVLIDEPPKRKRKSSTGENGSKKAPEKSKSKKTAKSTAALSKDEETIKRLKSLVVACGTRKVWSRVFQGLDTPQQQIKKLKQILADLGMTGRLSMEQAKAIKEKKELEQELADVKEFAAKMEKRGHNSAKSSSVEADTMSPDKGKGNSSEDEEEVEAPRQRMTARKSIMAFLGDQSSDED